MAEEFQYRLKQGGIVVAAVSAPDRDDARREMARYVRQYEQDGPVDVQFKTGDRWKSI